MPEVPECMVRRYEALDALIRELSTMSNDSQPYSDPGVRLMCHFWNILKEDPNCNLTEEVQQCLCPSTIIPSRTTEPKFPMHYTCYMANENPSSQESAGGAPPSNKPSAASGPPLSGKPSTGSGAAPSGRQTCRSPASCGTKQPPLSKVLCNLKKAASVDKNCNSKLKELLAVEKHLRGEIARLEQREQEGIRLMKEADSMWSQMEDSYKEKIAESLSRQKDLVKELQEIEQSAAKWRKNKKDLEAQIESINKCQLGIIEKINQKSNDIKAIDADTEAFKKRMVSAKKEAEVAKKTLGTKKTASDARVAIIANEITKIRHQIEEKTKKRESVEAKGNSYITDARESLQQLCKTLLQKKLEHEDLKAERNALIGDINLLKDTCDLCKDKCGKKEENIKEEIKKLNVEISQFQVKCIKCHKCESTDSRRFCVDCPRCAQRRECIVSDDICTADPKEECVCLIVKKRFLDNIFENMYTVLERQIKTMCGKVAADKVVECLKRSRNGKLNETTKMLLRDFTLQAVKKNLNLTIVGGAVKTRCELDPATYTKLMLCLKCVIPTPPPKSDKGTDVKKDPCLRWGGASECNCPRGPKACICTSKANAPPKNPVPCPPPPADDDDNVERDVCPHEKDYSICGPTCPGRTPNRVGTDVSEFRPESCQDQSCPFGKNMRAAQCVLGPESLKKTQSPWKLVPARPTRMPKDQAQCDCGPAANYSCICQTKCSRDAKQLKAGLATDCLKKSFQIRKTKTNPTINQLYKLEYTDQSDKYTNFNSLNEKCEQETQTIDTPKTLEKRTNPMVTIKNHKLSVGIDNQTNNMQQSVDYFVNLKKTTSGTLAMEMDKTLIETLRKNAQEGSEKIVYLRKTDSEQYLIDFDHKDEFPEVKLAVKHTVTGAIAFEIDKNNVSNVQHLTFTNDAGVAMNAPSLTEVKSNVYKSGISDEKKLGNKKQDLKFHKTNKTWDKTRAKRTLENKLQQHFDEIILGNEKDIKMINIYKKNEPNADKTKSAKTKTDRYRKELQLFYEQNVYKIILNVNAENGTSANVEGNIIKTPSGNLALDINKLYEFGELSNTVNEQPVLLDKLGSGMYNLSIGFQSEKDSKAPNSVLRKTSSGGLLIVVTEPILGTGSLKRKPNLSLNNLFKVKVTGITDDVKLAILKMSSSHNYVLVLDKEFEKQYTEYLDCKIADNSECFVELRKTNSVISINFDKDGKKNALLVKSPSQNIRVLVNGPGFEKWSSKKATSRNFSELFENCIRPAEHINKKMSKTMKSDITHAKSSSDSHLYKGLRGKDKVFNKTSAKLRRTESGQYAAILDKEIKKSFINELKNYLAQSPHGLIPIKKTNSGEITIILNPDDSESLQLGSLKITPSGNIYMVVDDSIIEDVENKWYNYKKRICVDSGSEHMIKKNLNPDDKTTTTSCDPNECVCEPTKCNCAHLRTALQQFKPFNETAMKFDTFMVLQKCTIDLTTRNKFYGGVKDWYPNKWKNICHKKIINIESEFCREKCSCSSIPDCDPNGMDDCYFYFRPSLSELNDIKMNMRSESSSSSKDEEITGNNLACTSSGNNFEQRPDTIGGPAYRSTEGWDSSQYLPHQLPYFIGGII